MAKQIFRKGTPLTVIWSLTKPDGTAMDLAGYRCRLYYATGNRESEATGTVVSANNISWVFAAAKQTIAGDYRMKLRLYQNGGLFCEIKYEDAFSLFEGTAETASVQSQEAYNNIVNLHTVAEYYLLKPVVPVVGDDLYWYVNGVKLVDAQGNWLSAEHTVRYDAETHNIIIDEGRVDAEGNSIQQTITAIADALVKFDEEEDSRQAAEGQGDYSDPEDYPATRRAKEAERQAAETARQVAEGDESSVAGDGSRRGNELQRMADEGSPEDEPGADTRWGAEKARRAAEGTPDDDPADVNVKTRWAQYKRALVATERANEAAAAAEHMVDIKTGPQGPQGNSGFQGDFTDYKIVNNLEGGDGEGGEWSGKEALSSEQGTVLNGKIRILGQDIYKEISVHSSSYPTQELGLSASGVFGSNTNYVHAAIPVQSGMKFQLRAIAATNVNYAFATSNEAVAGNPIPVVQGTSVMTINAGNMAIITIPQGCSYLLFDSYRGNVIVDWGRLDYTKATAVDSVGYNFRVLWDVLSLTSLEVTITNIKISYTNGKTRTYNVNNTQMLTRGNSLVLRDGVIVEEPGEFSEVIWSDDILLLYMSSSGRIVGGLLKDIALSSIGKPSVFSSVTSFNYAFPSIYIGRLYNAENGDGQTVNQNFTFDFSATPQLDTLVGYTNSQAHIQLKMVNHNEVARNETELLRVSGTGIPVGGAMKESVLAHLLQQGQATPVTIQPELQYEAISTTTGDFGIANNITSLQHISTPRYIKVPDGFRLRSNKGGTYQVFYYGEDFGYLSYETRTLTAGSDVSVSPPEGTAYIKISTYNESLPGALSLPIVTLTGLFNNGWDVPNPRPADDGYHRIATLVNVTNPNCCDDVSNPAIVQDERNLLWDYGMLCLPTTYKSVGAPTRLIIYCHGGNVNYSSTAVRFDSQDLEPEYWLAEGYAVMDTEGNPFDNMNEHFQIPQAMDCYIAAYNWVLAHYNIRRDGVLLGGRSMGGGMTFNLVRAQCPIPVIAACPNAAHGMCVGGTTPAGTTGERQRFYAEHCGFDIPEGFDWETSYYAGNTYTDGSKKKLFYDNWDKLVKNVPIWSMCTDLPTSDEAKRELIDNFYVAGSGHPSVRNTLWGALHAMARCPIKLFGCYEDASCPPADTANLYYRMLTNAAQIAEVRLFHSYKDYSGTGTTAHHYDTQDPALRASVITKYGVEMQNVPIVYIEMLQFWRRYEQQN